MPRPPRVPRHWLVKSEPACYSIDDLARDGTTCWDGVRNYQARNFMRDEMQVGDLVLFHHSNGDPSGVAGVARVARAAYTDHTAFDPKHEHHDPRSDPSAPAWVMVDLAFVEGFAAVVSLERLKSERGLESMLVLRRGQRLSVMPVEGPHFERVCALGRAPKSAQKSAPKSAPKSPSSSRAGRGSTSSRRTSSPTTPEPLPATTKSRAAAAGPRPATDGKPRRTSGR